MIFYDSYSAENLSFSLNASGYVSTLPLEEPDYIKLALEKSVEEVTGKPCTSEQLKLKMGFY